MSAKSSHAAPRFPQLALATDPERMRPVLQEHLRPLDGQTYEVRTCRVSFARGRSDNRCLLHYTLDLREPNTGREWSQVVTGIIYPERRTRRIWEKLELTDSAAVPGAGPALAPVVYVPDLDLLLQVFPYDHRLPALAHVLAGPPPELTPLLLHLFGPGDWQIESWDAATVRYRVDMRALVRVAARAREAGGGPTEERRFYVKVYRDMQGEEADRLQRALAEGADGAFGVAPSIGYLPGPRLLVQEEVSGISLLYMLRHKQDVVSTVRKTAHAVAALHRLDLDAPRVRPLASELDRLERSGTQLRSGFPHLRPAIDEVVGAVLAGLADPDASPQVAIHGDLKPEHVLLDGDRVILLDFDRLAKSDPLVDVANLLVHLATRARQTGDRPGVVARAFAEEYLGQAPAAFRARLPLWYAAAILNEATHHLRGQRERGQRERGRLRDGGDWVEGLVREAQAALAGAAW